MKSAEHALDNAIRDEQQALAYELMGHRQLARSALESAVEDLGFAIEHVEEGLAAGEVPPSVAAESVLDLREAQHEDRTAKRTKNTLSDKVRERHIRLALLHKRRALKTLKQVQTTTTGTTVLHEDTPPPPPPLVEDGSDLTGDPEAILGDIAADSETLNEIEKELLEKRGAKGSAASLFDPFLAATRASAASANSNVTANGQVMSYTVKGYAISSNRPGVNGSGEIRLGIEEPQPNGQLKVISTSNPPNLLPHTPGTYTFQIGPPATGFAMPVKVGELLSLDTPGGNYAVFSSRGRGTAALERRARGRTEPGHPVDALFARERRTVDDGRHPAERSDHRARRNRKDAQGRTKRRARGNRARW